MKNLSLGEKVPQHIQETVSKSKKKEIIGPQYPYKRKMKRREYESEKQKLQIELLKTQKWVNETGKKMVLIFEGRDAAGKGGTIKRFMEHINPRGAKVVALGVPSENEKGQWYFQRYIQRLPTQGEIILFDRSWYNRAVIEPVMGFCSDQQYQQFLDQVPEVERTLVDGARRRPSASR